MGPFGDRHGVLGGCGHRSRARPLFVAPEPGDHASPSLTQRVRISTSLAGNLPVGGISSSSNRIACRKGSGPAPRGNGWPQIAAANQGVSAIEPKPPAHLGTVPMAFQAAGLQDRTNLISKKRTCSEVADFTRLIAIFLVRPSPDIVLRETRPTQPPK